MYTNKCIPAISTFSISKTDIYDSHRFSCDRLKLEIRFAQISLNDIFCHDMSFDEKSNAIILIILILFSPQHRMQTRAEHRKIGNKFQQNI